jgi:hypothetical protein
MKEITSAILMITVAIIITIITAAWIGHIGFSAKIEIDAQIYAANYNFGVLNEDARFDISIENSLNKSRIFNVIVSADEHEIFNETIEIMGLATRNLTINQKLLFTGLWTITVFEENKIVDGYSFVTVANNAEADLKITQIDNINFNNNLSIISLIVSISSLILGIVSFWYVKVRVKKGEKGKIEKKTKKQRDLDSK